MILLPNANGVISSDWIPVGETAEWECLDDDNGNTSYVKCNDNLAIMGIEYANPSVVEADIASIDSVRFLSSGKSTHRTDPSRVQIEYDTSGVSAYSETVAYDAHRTDYETINGTARPYSDGSSAAWTYANLEALELTCTKQQTIEVYLSYLALEVTYTEAVAADNATFFGANF